MAKSPDLTEQNPVSPEVFSRRSFLQYGTAFGARAFLGFPETTTVEQGTKPTEVNGQIVPGVQEGDIPLSGVVTLPRVEILKPRISAEENLKRFWGDAYIPSLELDQMLEAAQTEPSVYGSFPEWTVPIEGVEDIRAGDISPQFRREMNRYLTGLLNATGLEAESTIGAFMGALYVKGSDGRIYQMGGGNKTMFRINEDNKAIEPILAVRDMARGRIQLNGDDTVEYQLNPQQMERRKNQVVVGELGSEGPSYEALVNGNHVTLRAGENREPSPDQEPNRLGSMFRHPSVDSRGNIGNTPSRIEPVKIVRYEDRTGHYVDERIQKLIDKHNANDTHYGDALFGLPISPAVVVKAITEGKEVDTVLQLFERRTVTDARGAKPLEWQVENGNDAQNLIRILTGRELLPPFQSTETGNDAAEIGNFAKDGVVLLNKGRKRLLFDNRQDPENNWQAIVAVAKRFASDDRFQFLYYDKPEDVPTTDEPQKYDTTVNWGATYSGAGIGKQLRIKTPEGIWQFHQSIPEVKPEDFNKLTRDFNLSVLRFFIGKDDPSVRWSDEFSTVLKKYALDPYNSGKMNFPLKLVSR